MYLVSRHPDAPTTADLSGAGDVDRMKQINKCIAMVYMTYCSYISVILIQYIDTLLDIVDEPGEAISFLLKQVCLSLFVYIRLM